MKPEKPSDLDAQVANKKRELISEIIEHKKNSSRSGAAEAIVRLKDQLLELSHIAKDPSPHAKQRLADWVSR